MERGSSVRETYALEKRRWRYEQKLSAREEESDTRRVAWMARPTINVIVPMGQEVVKWSGCRYKLITIG